MQLWCPYLVKHLTVKASPYIRLYSGHGRRAGLHNEAENRRKDLLHLSTAAHSEREGGERYCDPCGPRFAVLIRLREFKGEWILNFSQGNRGVGRTRVIRSDESILTTVERGQGDRATAEEGLRMRRASLASRSPRNNTTS